MTSALCSVHVSSPIADRACWLSSGYAFHSFCRCTCCHLSGYPHRCFLSSLVVSSAGALVDSSPPKLVDYSPAAIFCREVRSKVLPPSTSGTVIRLRLIHYGFFGCHIGWLGLILKLISSSSCVSRDCRDGVGIAKTESGYHSGL